MAITRAISNSSVLMFVSTVFAGSSGRAPAGAPAIASGAGSSVSTAGVHMSCHVQRYAFTLMAMGDPFQVFNGSPAINGAGAVAFRATLLDRREGVFVSDGGDVATIADTSTPPGMFSWFANGFATTPSIDDDGRVAFFAVLRNAREGIFISDGEDVTTVAVGPTGSFSRSWGSPSMSNGVVAFGARFGDLEGIFTGSGGPLTTIAVGPFNSFITLPAINRAGAVAFVAAPNGDRVWRLFVGDGGPLTTIVDFTAGQYVNFSNIPAINDRGTVVFGAELPDRGFVFTGDGGPLSPVADTSGPFKYFSSVSGINNLGTVVFEAFVRDVGLGIFTGDDPDRDTVILTGDELFGSTVTSVDFFNPRGINDTGQIAFRFVLADGRSGIARAEPL